MNEEVLFKVVAIVDFEAAAGNQLSFKRGEEIEVLKRRKNERVSGNPSIFCGLVELE